MNTKKDSFFMNLRPLYRLLISIVIALLVFAVVFGQNMKPLITMVIAWIAFAVSYLAMDWFIIFKRPIEQIKKKARDDDGSVAFVFFIVLLASVSSMFAVLFITTSKESNPENEFFNIGAAVTAMVLSWFLVHTQYVFHYGHEYYDEDKTVKNEQAEGLDFPGDDEPDYLDFAYFSFCMGCTFQVSDVEISSREIRRIVLVHSLISFFMNTFLVALTINIVAGLSN